MLSSLSCCFPFRRRQPARQDAAALRFNTQAATSRDEVIFFNAPLSPEMQWERNQQLMNAIRKKGILNINAVTGAIQRGAKVQGEAYYRSAPPLHEAARCDYPEAIEVLLENGADIDHVNFDEETPLYWAIHYEKPDAIKTLLTHGAKLTLIPEALRQQHTQQLNRILRDCYPSLNVNQLIQNEKERLQVPELTLEQLNPLKKQVNQALKIIQQFNHAGIKLNQQILIPLKTQFHQLLVNTNEHLRNPNLSRVEKITLIARLRPILNSGLQFNQHQVTAIAEQSNNLRYMEGLTSATNAGAERYPLGLYVVNLSIGQQPSSESPVNTD